MISERELHLGIVKIGKQELKALIKECLVEILAEGLGSNLTEVVHTAPRNNGQRNRDVEPIPGQPRHPAVAQQRRQSPLDERVTPRRMSAPNPIPPEITALTRDPVMAAIFADTAQTTLQEQARGVMPGDVAAQAAARTAPEQMFDEATMDKWNQAAFQSARPEPAGIPASFIQDLLKGD